MNSDSRLWTFYQTKNKHVFDGSVHRYKMLYKIVHRLIGPRGKILEIGFGNGYLLKILSSKYECYGTDISKSNVDLMSNRLKGVSFKYCSTSGKLPYRDDEFDCLIASEVLEHMGNSQLVKTIQEVIRVVKKNGYIIVTVPAEEDIDKEKIYCPKCRHKFHRWGHKQTWNEDKIKRLFIDFKDIKISDVFIRYPGKNLFENTISIVLLFLRTIINKFYKLPGRTYLICARNNK